MNQALNQSYFQSRKTKAKKTLAKSPQKPTVIYLIANWDASFIWGESYPSKASAKKALSTIKTEMPLFVYECKTSADPLNFKLIKDAWMFVEDRYHPVQMLVSERLQAFLNKE